MIMYCFCSSVFVAGAVLALATPAHAQRDWDTGSADSSFAWKGPIPAGGTIHVEDLNGGIDVEASDNGTTTVTAVKHWRHSDPASVRIVVEPAGNEVTVCALWGDATSCGDRGHHGGHEVHNNDVSVHFTVHVAKGVKVNLVTVNGSVDVRGATVAVDAHTVNGRIEIATLGGPVTAESVNGGVRATIDHLVSSNEPLELTTVNGSVELEAPAELNAALDAETVNGGVQSDFPVQINSMKVRTRIRGTIGQGGRELRLHTVNGSVRLRKLG
jgi:DUF4097 and DUF4098 domain-containing protein YvlB